MRSRGALRRELTRCLRTGRALRHPGRQPGQRKNRIPDMVNISERPAEVKDRAVPGHWEGDLIIGKRNLTVIGTLVERSSGYTMLAADIEIFFCDPHKPWQRGSNENTNGLLRQYFPKMDTLGASSGVDGSEPAGRYESHGMSGDSGVSRTQAGRFTNLVTDVWPSMDEAFLATST